MKRFPEPVGYQLSVYEELRQSALDFFAGGWHGLPIQPRNNPLLIASTGSGKTFLVNRLAEELGLPSFSATVGDWILLGASSRAAPPTLPTLYRFIHDHSRGIVFLDEFEKMGRGDDGVSDWRKFCQLEIHSVLDRKILCGVLADESAPKFSLSAEELSERFRHSIYIIAAGAWQPLWQSAPHPIGFGEFPNESHLPDHAQLGEILSLEILNRCNEPLILPPMNEKDYHSVFAEVFSRLPANLRAVMQQPTENQIQEAVRNNKAFRFFEELVSRAVRALRLAEEAKTPASEQTVEETDRVAQQSCITLSS